MCGQEILVGFELGRKNIGNVITIFGSRCEWWTLVLCLNGGVTGIDKILRACRGAFRFRQGGLNTHL